MLKECLEIFEEVKDVVGDRIVLDNYIPKDGTYLLVTMYENGFEISNQLDLKYDKKSRILNGKEFEHYTELVYYDYYSRLLDMNKPIDPKKVIHSNNYLTLFVKKESVVQGNLTEAIIDKYYDILLEPRTKYKSKHALKLYENVEEEVGEVPEEEIEKIRKWIKNNIYDLKVDFTRKDYLKIFFVHENEAETQNRYQKEGTRYIIPNIYNNNDYNVVINDEIIGLPNNNMGMNTKKPFLGNRTRGENQMPILIDKNQALKQLEFFDYLYGLASRGKQNIYFDTRNRRIYAYTNTEFIDRPISGYFLRVQKGKELEIRDYDQVIKYNPNLKRLFYMYCYAPTSKEEIKGERNTYTKGYEIEDIVDEMFFNKCLKGNYYTDASDISVKDPDIRKSILQHREKLKVFFRLDEYLDVRRTMESAAMIAIKNSLVNGYGTKVKKQINLKFSLEDYFNNNNEKEVFMNKIEEAFVKHVLSSEEFEFEKREEFFFGAGQLSAFLISKSKSKNANMSFVNPFLKARDVKKLKALIKQLFLKYGYAIKLGDNRFKRVYSAILLYEDDGKIDDEMFIAGFVSDSKFYIKANEGGNNNE